MKLQKLFAVLAAAFMASQASAAVRITEFMYNSVAGATGEFVEFTNLGASPIDFTGWSFDDSSRLPGSTSLSAFGTVNAGESVILTDADATAFTTSWSLTGVKVIGNNAENLSRGDEINLYDASNALVDRLTYSDQTYPGTPRTNGASAWAPVSGDGPFGTITSAWVLSTVGDSQGSVTATTGDIGSPGRYSVPEPTMAGGLTLVLMGFARRHRRR